MYLSNTGFEDFSGLLLTFLCDRPTNFEEEDKQHTHTQQFGENSRTNCPKYIYNRQKKKSLFVLHNKVGGHLSRDIFSVYS